MSNQDNKERRKDERVFFREDVLVDGTKMCTTMDISEGGLFISAIQAFEQNSMIDITIPFKGHKLMLKAQVQYSQPGIGIGVGFVDINTEQKAIIRKLIESIIKDSGKFKA